MKAYVRMDPRTDERKAHYSPAQFGAFHKLLYLAARQKHRGRFKSMAALLGQLPPAYARHVPFLMEERDLMQLPDGRLEVPGWDDWQEGDLTVGERMKRLRAKGRTGDDQP